MAIVICLKTDCVYSKKRKVDKKYQCTADVIGIERDNRCDTYTTFPNDYECLREKEGGY